MGAPVRAHRMHSPKCGTEETCGLPHIIIKNEGGLRPPVLSVHHINKKETCGLPHIIIKNEGEIRPPVQKRPVTGVLRPPHL